MMESLKKLLEEMFKNPAKMTPELINQIMAETAQYVQELQGKLDSGDEEAKERMMKEAAELREFLEAKMGALFASGAFTAEKLTSVVGAMFGAKAEKLESKPRAKSKVTPLIKP